MIKIQFLKITPEMLSILSEIDEFKTRWRFTGGLTPQKLGALKRVASIESIASSNRIEGNRLSNKDVETLLSKLDRASFRSRDEQEVAGYARTMDIIFDNFDAIPLTENYIKQFHKTLLQFTEKDRRHRGEYKKISNSVAAFDSKGKEVGVIFETATPFDTPRLMKELIEWTNANLSEKYYHPLLVIALFIVMFLAVHPFQDGNGRLSRILTTLLLLKAGYSYVPYASMEAVIEDNKEGYYRALHQTQSTLKKRHDYEPWIMFFLRTMQRQKIRLENKIDGMENNLALTLPKLSAVIMELFGTNKRLTVSEVRELTQANINTIKKHLKGLTDKGLLQKHGATKGAWYTN